MCRTITLERVDDVPADAHVCHYDELAEPAKVRFPSLAGATDASVDGAVIDGFQGCDLVKYTAYYEISVQ